VAVNAWKCSFKCSSTMPENEASSATEQQPASSDAADSPLTTSGQEMPAEAETAPAKNSMEPKEVTDNLEDTSRAQQKKRVTIVENGKAGEEEAKAQSNDANNNNNGGKPADSPSPPLVVGQAPKVKINLKTSRVKELTGPAASASSDPADSAAVDGVMRFTYKVPASIRRRSLPAPPLQLPPHPFPPSPMQI